MDKILENCLNELLANEKGNIIYFPREDTLQIMDLPDGNIRKNLKPRYIQGVYLSNDDTIQVWVVTPTTDGRIKHKIQEYDFRNFDTTTKGLILQKACRYHD